MIASDFARNDCTVGNRRRTYASLQREWRCSDCGGRLVIRSDGNGRRIACGRCGGHDIMHEYDYDRGQLEAIEVLDALPEQLRAVVGGNDSNITGADIAAARAELAGSRDANSPGSIRRLAELHAAHREMRKEN